MQKNVNGREQEVLLDDSRWVLVWNENFDSGKLETGTYYNADVVEQEAEGSYTARVGRVHPGDYDSPMKGTSIDRGSITLTVKGLVPNTKYNLTAQACIEGENSKLWVGAVDLENEKYHIVKDVHEEVTSKSWTYISLNLTTGPRTTEVAFYCLLEGQPGLGYLKDMNVFKLDSVGNENNQNWERFGSKPESKENEFPLTIPAIQKFIYNPNVGKWFPKDKGRIIIDKGYQSQLADDAKLFLAEFNTDDSIKSNYIIENCSSKDARPGDIVFTIGEIKDSNMLEPANSIRKENYRIEIDENVLTITSPTNTGVFYGTRTILQALRLQNWLPGGTVIDWPNDRFRGLQVDTGRRHFTIDWLKQQIRDLAWTKMNIMHLRMKDDQGLRVESDVAPELVAPEHYSKKEIRELVEFAARYHVTLLPEIDTPGHSAMDVRVYPDYGLRLKDGSVASVLDYTKWEVREYVKKLVLEISDLFQSPYFHLGGDEYENSAEVAPHLADWAKEQLVPEATWYDGYEFYLNQLAEPLIEKGVRPWIWVDMIDPGEGVMDLDTNFIIDYWAKWDRAPLAPEFHKAGYETVNKNSDWMYYDLWPDKIGSDDPRRHPENVYEVWESDGYMKKAGWGAAVTRPKDDHTIYLNQKAEKHSGAMFAIWDDAHGWPAEKWVTKGMLPRIRAFSQKVWGSPKSAYTYAEFDPFICWIGYSPDEPLY
ncbi:family 20 glycosylhydrolase [Virgibacillus necropolis]|uniref:beta-N-acetylhexosaminidase n=1 Tax=Virgibacillus necropolis TaxID=163877 RepID=A0A221M975_9BACI|nr:family 20 glycosylhydrolase [Virgibacillus necropolis]ASN04179.1 hypothetical protein CFK40_03735 [Virgibacillus necropolis]